MITITIHVDGEGHLLAIDGSGMIPGQHLCVMINMEGAEEPLRVEVVRIGDKLLQMKSEGN